MGSVGVDVLPDLPSMKLLLLLVLPCAVVRATPRPHCRAIDLGLFDGKVLIEEVGDVERLAEFARFVQSHVPRTLSAFHTDSGTGGGSSIKEVVQEIVKHVEEQLNKVDNAIQPPIQEVIDDVKAAVTLSPDTTPDSNQPTNPSDDAKLIEDAIGNIVDAVKNVLKSFEDPSQPIDIDTIKAISLGVIAGVRQILEEISIDFLDLIFPEDDVPGFLPHPNLPSLPSLDDLANFQLSDWPTLCKVLWWPKDDEKCEAMVCGACSTSLMAASEVCYQTNAGYTTSSCLASVLGDNGGCSRCAKRFFHGY